MIVQNLIDQCLLRLQNLYNKEEALSISKLLVEKYMDQNQKSSTEYKNLIIDKGTHTTIQEKMVALLEGKPIQYVLEEAWFYKYPFYVNAAVLIPRPETEELVFAILQVLKQHKPELPKILEIGTGSGCIAISIKKEYPKADITALDISPAALSVAKKNAVQLGANINFVQTDFLEERLWKDFSDDYDIIVSNPPYIPPVQKDQMHKNVLDYEPHLALFVREENPLVFYEKIAGFSKRQLKNIKIFCEINETFGDAVAKLFKHSGFEIVEVLKDMQQKDRILFAQRNP